jgi:integrase
MQIPNRFNRQEGVAMASIYRRGTTGIYQVSWIDENGLRRARSTRTTNRRAALQVAKDLIHQPQPSLQLLPLEELLVLWASELNALGRCPRYVRERVQTVSKIGLDVYKANLRLGDLAETGRSDRTVQVAYGALVQFGKWCLINGHRDRDPMLGLKKPSRRTGRVYVRGVLTKHQASVLCSHLGIHKDRRLVYRTALSTGLRLGELKKLKIENLKVLKGQPSIHLRPSEVKNRFESIIPIQLDLFKDLMRGLNMKPFARGAVRLRKDLVIAGLPTEDEDGHTIDFHSLRATFGDLLIQQGVPIPTVARLMRHSDGGALLLKRYAGGWTPKPLLLQHYATITSTCS